MKDFTKSLKLTKLACLLLAATIATNLSLPTARVLAIPDVPYYAGNDVLYFDPDAATCLAGDSGSPALTSATTQAIKQKIWSFLKSKGASDEQAAGVMGNMQAESGFVPTRHQGTGSVWNDGYSNAWGLAQWDGGRRYKAPNGGILGKIPANLRKYADIQYDTRRNPSVQIPVADLDALVTYELTYLYQESTNRKVNAQGFGDAGTEWGTLLQQKTIENATVFWHNNFEVSADSASEVLANRGGAAKKIYAEFSGKTAPAAGENTTAESICSPGATGNPKLSEYVLKYAWPTYRGNDTKMKPEYAAASVTARKENRYIGGCDGVDCGGFVTTLLVDSGFEPGYNYGGKISGGAGFVPIQKTWAEKNWQKIGMGNKINAADLKPGDVAYLPGHTYVYVGEIKGFGSKIASSSWCERAPMAGTEKITASDTVWYRKK